MTTVSIEQAQAELPQLLEGLATGDEVVITQGETPVGKLTRIPLPNGRPIAGRGRGMIVYLAEDESHLADFVDYLPTDDEVSAARASASIAKDGAKDAQP